MTDRKPEPVRTLHARAIIIVVAVALLMVATAYAGVLTVLVRNAEKPEPEITAYAHGKSVTVPPYMYCTVRMEHCTYGATVTLEVPPGYRLQLSLPAPLADAPWQALLRYRLPNGDEVQRIATHREHADKLALTFDSQPAPDVQLVGVEIQLPIPARDQAGEEFFIPHAAWSIKTA